MFLMVFGCTRRLDRRYDSSSVGLRAGPAGPPDAPALDVRASIAVDFVTGGASGRGSASRVVHHSFSVARFGLSR